MSHNPDGLLFILVVLLCALCLGLIIWNVSGTLANLIARWMSKKNKTPTFKAGWDKYEDFDY